MAQGAPLLRVDGVRKRYAGIVALAGVDLEFRAGEVTALLGENGAGKSTLMKILAGAERPDAGSITLDGREVTARTPREAFREGIAMVYQELTLFPDLDVLSNLFVWQAPHRRSGLLDRRRMARLARPVLAEVGLDVPLTTPVSALRLGQRQIVEIARALLADAKVLILDEPNSALNAEETTRLLSIVRRLRERGVVIIYISHRLEEVFEIADSVAVLRNGRLVEHVPAAQTSIRQAVHSMIGRDPTEMVREERMAPHEATTEVRLERVSVRSRLTDVDLRLAPGEIVGLIGLDGAGVMDVFDVLFGVQTPDSGEVQLPGGRGRPRSVREAVRAGVARVPADRRRTGVMLEQSIEDNISQVSAGVLGDAGFLLDRRKLGAQARARCDALHVKAGSLSAPVISLSGGNQQKVVLGKWLEADPRLVLLDDPTRGVDVGAKAEIYDILQRLAEEGRIVVFSSSELREYVLLCDRVVVLHRGRVAGELAANELSEHRLLEAINTGEL